MKKTLSTLMILVMMICFNTRLHVSANRLTVMKYCAIAVLHSIEIIYLGYRFYLYGINETLNDPDYKTKAHRQNIDELKHTISILQDSVKSVFKELYDCKKGPKVYTC